MGYDSDSDDGIDHELIAFMRARMGLDDPVPKTTTEVSTTTKVASSAKFIANHSIDVAIDMQATKAAADKIWDQMESKKYTAEAWNANPLHPSVETDGADFVLDFVFTVDILNFSFWSTRPDAVEGNEGRFSIEWEGKKVTGYWSLIAALRRALSEGIPITSPSFWISDEFTPEVLSTVFRSATSEPIPLLKERFDCLREAGSVIQKTYGGKTSGLITQADRSAGRLVNLLSRDFDCFRDEHTFHEKSVQILKRAQIFVADLWAAFRGVGYGEFTDIDCITMFADYRVPQMLQSMQCVRYSPRLEYHIIDHKDIPSGSVWEIEMRGCSIWCVETIKMMIQKAHPGTHVNAVLIDFFLYDTVKELEREILIKEKALESQSQLEKEEEDGEGPNGVIFETEGPKLVPHHRTRSIWY